MIQTEEAVWRATQVFYRRTHAVQNESGPRRKFCAARSEFQTSLRQSSITGTPGRRSV
ncbi:unnamed protein product [Gemmata massiliana]|uniref:Uncharacterized protein n=1 Tax=Gemmata massiliana TaxID=1210884 RepID=A0A6P2D628_9BACT|nr:unnamed protein product [Gemmata massiliana]